jgi:NAD(P)-dependent dehydrogenase (short-subunit alcohol dehydrogenase family)
MELKDAVAIVTGGGGAGSGRAIARRFAREGAAVVVADVDETGGRQTVRSIEAEQGRAAFCAADVASDADVRALFEFTERTYGRLDVLVNDASKVHQGEPLEYWLETLQVDLAGAMRCILAAVPAMQRRRGGAIVNLGSTSALGYGRRAGPWPAYDAAKAGIMHLSAALAVLHTSHGVRVNCLVPDWVATPEVTEFVERMTPGERLAGGVPDVLLSVDDVAGAVVRLATDEALTGRVLVWWCGEPPRFIRREDPGYAVLE